MQAGSSRRRQRNEMAQLQNPSTMTNLSSMPADDNPTTPKITIRLCRPTHFAPGKSVIVGDPTTIDISVDAPLGGLQKFLNHFKTSGTLQRMNIINQEGNRAGQHIVDALLDAAATSDTIKQLAIDKCLIGLNALASAVSTMRIMSLVDCRCAANLTEEGNRTALVDRWMSNSRLERFRIQRTFDTNFLGALLKSLHKLPALNTIEIGISNATTAGHLRDFLLACKHKRAITIFFNDCRFDEATIHRLLQGLRGTKLFVYLYFNRCCWKARPGTSSQDVEDLSTVLIDGIKSIPRKKYAFFHEFEETWLQDVASEYGHDHANMPPFDAELEQGHKEAAIIPASAKPAASAQRKPEGKNKKKGRGGK